MVSAKQSLRLRSNEELIQQRRTTNSPTIEEDFTIDDEEPFEEPCSTPKQEAMVQKGDKRNDDEAEVNTLNSTKSEWSEKKNAWSEKKNAKDKSKSNHSIFWSLSELEDSNTKTGSKNIVDQRNDVTGQGRQRLEYREGVSSDQAQPLPAKIGKKAFSKSGVQFRDERHNRKPENFAIRSMRSIDEESNVFDEVSAFSVASRAPSVAVSVTKRTRNTRPSLRSPRLRSPRLRSPRPPRTPKTVAEDSVLIEDIIQEEFEYGKNQTVVHSQDEDLLDPFFEKVEDRVCESSHHRKSYKRNKKPGLRHIMSPFFEKLESYDKVFEQLEDVLCAEDAEDASSKEAQHTPAAIFAQCLDQIDNFDPDFKSKVMDCQHNVDFYGHFSGYSSDEDDYSQSSNVSNEQIEFSERTYNSFSSRPGRHRAKTMKHQWRSAISKLKLRQSILAESVKQNAAKALSSCNPEISDTKGAEDPSDVLSHGPSDEGEQNTCDKPTTPKEWIKMWKSRVDSVSEKFLERAQCSSSSIKMTESSSFDQEQSKTMENQNSIIENEEHDVGFDDDFTDFETAESGIDTETSEMNFEQDERPPMRRLMESRTSAQCRVPSKMSDGYTLVDSIRQASVSDATKEASKLSRDPRGNKLKADGSTHVRSRSSPGLKLNLDAKLIKEHERIRSPRSSETNETSDLTAVISSTSDIDVTHMVS